MRRRPAPASTRFTWNAIALLGVLRRWPIIRETIVGADPRPFDEGAFLELCLGWNRKTHQRHIPTDMNVYAWRGPVHATLCAHESCRPVIAKLTKGRGWWFYRGRYTWRLNLAAFTFVLALEWCHTKNFERLDGPPNAITG
jgi:hypothetical protein